MSVELPKDAEGREIPLNTTVLFDSCGKPVNIVLWAYTTDFNSKDSWVNSWRAINEDLDGLEPELLYLNRPDSWERLEDDLSRAAEFGVVVASCRYFTAGRCVDCRMHNGFTCGTRKTELAFADVLERIRMLRGED